MNIRISIILLVFLFQSTMSFSQYIPLVEESKYWIFNSHFSNDLPNIAGGYLIKFAGDTTILNNEYKKVIQQELSGTHPCPPEEQPCFSFDIPYKTLNENTIGFIREDVAQKKIGYRSLMENDCGGEEKLIFDFSLELGESLDSCSFVALGAMPGYGIVDSITNIFYYDKNRRTINTTGLVTYIGLPYEGNVEILEGIGFKNFGLFHKPGNLNGLVDFCEGTLSSCNIVSSLSNPGQESGYLKLYPNPVTDFLTIESALKIRSISIVDNLGKNYKVNAIENRIDVSEMPTGIYTCLVVDQKGRVIVEKFIKM